MSELGVQSSEMSAGLFAWLESFKVPSIVTLNSTYWSLPGLRQINSFLKLATHSLQAGDVGLDFGQNGIRNAFAPWRWLSGAGFSGSAEQNRIQWVDHALWYPVDSSKMESVKFFLRHPSTMNSWELWSIFWILPIGAWPMVYVYYIETWVHHFVDNLIVLICSKCEIETITTSKGGWGPDQICSTYKMRLMEVKKSGPTTQDCSHAACYGACLPRTPQSKSGCWSSSRPGNAHSIPEFRWEPIGKMGCWLRLDDHQAL